ncbi:MAG: FtsX-like permease family protein, partial [Gemmatimonadota bacterium]
HASPLRWLGIVLALLGASALILAVSGLYSVMRYIASQRRREIGIRMALGARGSTITRMILRYSLKLSLIGGALGLWGALILVGALRKFSPDLPLFDPPVYLGVLLLLAAAGTLGAYGPARSAAHIEPSEALGAQ